ncbi:MAG: hypothetical protein U0414_13320 [Polyangiaceae bacterium]
MTALAALVCGVVAMFGERHEAAYPRATRGATLSRVALALFSAAALVLLAIAASALFKSPSTVSIGPRLARIGSFDAAATLSLTPMAGALAAVTLVGALLFAVGAPRDARPAEFALAALVATGAVEAALAEGFAPFIAGWAGVAVGGAALLARTSRRAASTTGGALGSTFGAVIAAAVLFWSLGGQFLDGRRFLADYKARFTVATIEAGQDLRGTSLDVLPSPGTITMLGSPGARVYLGVANESQITPRLPPDVVSPFQRFEINPGVQKVTIDAGGGTIIGGDGHDIALVDNVRVLPGSKLLVKVVGPTMSFADAADQIGALDAAFRARAIGGVPVLDLAALALVLGLIALAGSLGRAASKSASAAAIAGLGASAIAAAAALRLGAPLSGSGALGSAVACVAGLVAAWNALVAARARSVGALVGRLTSAGVALASISVIVPAAAAGVTLAGASVACVALAIGVERLTDPMRNSVDSAVSAAIRPAMIAMGLALVIGAAAIACGAVVRGGALGVVAAMTAVATAGLAVYAIARASAFMEIVELVPVEDAPPPKKSKKSKKGGASSEVAAARVLAPKPVDKPPFPLPRQSIALAATTALGAATGALWLARGLGTQASAVLQIGLTAALVVGGAAIAWRVRAIADDPKRRSASFEGEPFLAVAANPSDATDGGVARSIGRVVRAFERALLFPLDRLAGVRADREERAEP